MSHPAIFFDRDGVLAKLVFRDGKPHSARTVEELEWMPEAKQTVQNLAVKGFYMFVVTNQPDIARKKMAPEVLEKMNQLLLSYFGGEAMLRGIYVCPHDSGDHCFCRKPKPGLLRQAAADWNLDLSQSFIIGDRAADMEAGRQAGCRTILLSYAHNADVGADFKIKQIENCLPIILK